MEFLTKPWPWYIAGPILGFSIPLLLFWGNKMLGISSSMRHLCAAILPSKASYFQYNWKDGLWSIVMVIGIMLGGLFAKQFTSNTETVEISETTKAELQQIGISNFEGLMPSEIFGLAQIFSLNGLIFIVLGGFLIGFGVRYANGCTSGHGLMGLSMGSVSSLIAIISFFVGGLLMTHIILPLIL